MPGEKVHNFRLSLKTEEHGWVGMNPGFAGMIYSREPQTVEDAAWRYLAMAGLLQAAMIKLEALGAGGKVIESFEGTNAEVLSDLEKRVTKQKSVENN